MFARARFALQRRSETDRQAGAADDNSSRSPARPFTDNDFDILAERVQEVHEPFGGETVQPVIAKSGDVGLFRPEFPGSFYLGQVLNQLINSQGEPHFGVLLVGIGEAEIGKDVP